MLRIAVLTQTSEEVVLGLQGSVEHREVPFLEQEGQAWRNRCVRLRVDLDQVRFIDGEGLDLLERWSAAGMLLCGGSLFVRTLLQGRGLSPEPG